MIDQHNGEILVEPLRSDARPHFEQLLADLASRFVSLPTEAIADTVDESLRSIGEFMDADRMRLFRFSRDHQRLDCTHEWKRQDLVLTIRSPQDNTSDRFPWLFQQLLTDEAVAIIDPNDLPSDAHVERDSLLANGVRSMLSVPIRISGEDIGAICFDCMRAHRQWSELTIQRITLIGQIIFSELQRARVEAELHASRRLVQAAHDTSPHVTYIFDLVRFQCVYVSPQVEQELGFTPDELYDMGPNILTDRTHPDDIARLPELLKRWVHIRDDEFLETELQLQHANGEWRTYATRERVLNRSQAGHVIEAIGTLRDVTEQKRAEEELQSHRAKLIHVARLSTMGEMVAGIAHELGQPLYSILNFVKASQNVVKTIDDPRLEEVCQWHDQVVKSAMRAGDIIRRLRDFARRSAPKREDVDIRFVIGEAVDLVAFETRQMSIDVQQELGSDPLMIRADRVQVLQVLVNLIQNAIEAMADNASDQRLLTIIATRNERSIEVSVIDCGRGLPNDSTPIFDAFVTTKEDGMGMGLAICKTIVESHSGNLMAESNQGGGAAFRLDFPIAKRE
jgi:PAS domain S-box-containing protein